MSRLDKKQLSKYEKIGLIIALVSAIIAFIGLVLDIFGYFNKDKVKGNLVLVTAPPSPPTMGPTTWQPELISLPYLSFESIILLVTLTASIFFIVHSFFGHDSMVFYLMKKLVIHPLLVLIILIVMFNLFIQPNVYDATTKAETYICNGNMDLSYGNYEQAILVFDKAIELEPWNTEAWNGKGAALNGLCRYQEAIMAYNKTIELEPWNTDAWNGKGAALNGLGRYEEAIKAYDKTIEIDPRDVAAWHNKGLALDALGRTAEAQVCFDKAKELGYP